MTRLLLLAVLTQVAPLTSSPIVVRDEGVRQGAGSATTINCTGAGVTCTKAGATMTLNVPGGSGGAGGSTYDGGKVGEAFAADASVYAQQAVVAATAYSADAGYYAHIARLAYSADASYSSIISGTAATAYAADASYSAATAADLSCAACVSVAEVSATGTPSASTYLRGDGTWATPSGGAGGTSPGGALGSVQFYSDAGVFGGAAGVGTDGTDLVLVERTTHAPNPATGTVMYLFDHYGAGSPAQLQLGSSALGFDQSVSPYPFVRSDDAWWGCVLPAAHGSTTYTATGRAAAGSATGTAAAVSWASTDARTRQVWVQHPAAATANTSCGYRSNIDYFWRGSATDQGGFLWWGAFALIATSSTSRVFAGLKDATATITATSDPNVTLDAAYIGCNAADTNLSVCSNDNVGTATCTTLGASFPCKATNTAYDVAFWSAANGASLGYWIRNLTSGTEASGTLSSDLPRNTVLLNWEFVLNTGANATANTIHIGGACWLANP